MSLLEENNLSSCRIIGGEKYAVLTSKFQVDMSEPGERSGHSSVQRVYYRKKPLSQVNRDKLRSQSWKAKSSRTMDIKRTSEQTQVKVSSECQTCDPQPATSIIDNGISCYQSGKHNGHSDQLHQFTSPDGVCIVGNSQIFCDSCGYVFHAQQSKLSDCLKCDNFTLAT